MAGEGCSKKKVSYYYSANFNNFHYGENHLMKPVRIAMANELVKKYGLFDKMKLYVPQKAATTDMTRFHSREYIQFLYSVSPSTMSKHESMMQKFNIADDCPVFEGLYDFCQMTTGGTLAAAAKLNKQESDICINWSGGFHHARESEASGFCYVNDVVLGILELLKYHQRVLYVDIDVHHGDGVEEAFCTTDRVMTISFHMFGERVFPGTGDIEAIGTGEGKYYAVNVPLLNGINDASYESIFVPVIAKAMEMYEPNVIVLQCGADSLTGDYLGRFNLSTRGHGKCVEFIKTFNLPVMLLGGGGYVIENVARLWTYETSIAVGVELTDKLPTNFYSNFFGTNQNLHVDSTNIVNRCTTRYLNRIKMQVLENLCMLPPVPSVQVRDVPEDAISECSDDEDSMNLDERVSQNEIHERVVPDNDVNEEEGYLTV